MKRMLGILFLFVLCFSFSQTICMAEETTKTPYKIGRLLPLTGYASWFGDLARNGGDLMVEMINASGGVDGHPLELITYDTKSKPEEAIRGAHRLISKDRVIAIIGDGSVPTALPVYDLGSQKKIPVFFACGFPVNPQKQPYAFNQAFPTVFAVQSPFKYFKEKGKTKIALLMTVGPLGELGSRIARKVAEQYGLTIVGEEKFETHAADVTSQLTKLRKLNPDVIFSFSTGEPPAMVARSMAQLNMNMPLLVSHGNATEGFQKMVADLPVTVIVPSGKLTVLEQLPDADPNKALLKKFNDKYMAKYKTPATYYAGQSADGVALLAEGLRIAGSADPEKLLDALEHIKNFAGNNGTFNMSPTDHQGTSLNDMVNITVKDGKWLLLN